MNGAPFGVDRFGAAIVCVLLAVPAATYADVAPVAITAQQQDVWVGQRATFFVKLRAKGTFSGAASFSLPEIPRSVIVKVGNPVVSSEEIEGESWFVQTHEFALFSQAEGSLQIPGFEVRYGSRDGFTGPVIDRVEQVPPLRFRIRRPPGSENLGFVVTTDQIEISESWDPSPGVAKAGDVYQRSISQLADNVTGMALAPPSTRLPEGIRVYLARPEVTDKLERGEFTGSRRDTITYVLQQEGTFTIPAVQYVWWIPDREQFGSFTLPAVSFEVLALPSAEEEAEEDVAHRKTWRLWGLAVVACVLCLFWWLDRTFRWIQRIRRWASPPERVAARKLMTACRSNDAEAAEAAWQDWVSLQSHGFEPSPMLGAAVADLHRHLFGPVSGTDWQGDRLAQGFRDDRSTRTARKIDRSCDLPSLNPGE